MAKGKHYPVLKRRRAEVVRLLTTHGYKPLNPKEDLDAQLQELEEWKKLMAELNELLMGL